MARRFLRRRAHGYARCCEEKRTVTYMYYWTGTPSVCVRQSCRTSLRARRCAGGQNGRSGWGQIADESGSGIHQRTLTKVA